MRRDKQCFEGKKGLWVCERGIHGEGKDFFGGGRRSREKEEVFFWTNLKDKEYFIKNLIKKHYSQ